MSNETTIVDAAKLAIVKIERAASIPEIYSKIVQLGLYEFNTPHPEHVLRTTIRRHTANVERVDSASSIEFVMTDEEIYGLYQSEAARVEKRVSSGTRRIHRATDKEEIIAALTGSGAGLFREIWRLLLFAAQVGVKNRRRSPLATIDTGRGIDQSTFGNCPSWPGILYLMAIAETESPEVLGSTAGAEDKRLTAFQEYANGGLAILAGVLPRQGG